MEPIRPPQRKKADISLPDHFSHSPPETLFTYIIRSQQGVLPILLLPSHTSSQLSAYYC